MTYPNVSEGSSDAVEEAGRPAEVKLMGAKFPV